MKRAFKICAYAKCSRIFYREHWHRDSEWRKKKFCRTECSEAQHNLMHPDRSGKKPSEPQRKTGQYHIRHPVIDRFICRYRPNGEAT